LSERKKRRVVVLYNTDYDAELIAAVDVSAVRASAQAITAAIADYGLDSELMGVHGRDIGEVIAGLDARAPDLVFNLCESLSGDARNEMFIPALLDMLGVPYTGSDALALGMCLHKERCKDVLAARGIATPPYVLIRDQRDLDDPRLDALEYPYFLKLAHEDASIGIDAGSRVHDRAALSERAMELCHAYRQPVIAERYIEGREVNVTLMGNGSEPGVLPLHEIDFSAMPEGRPHIVSYAAKWDESHVDYAGTRSVPMREATGALRQAIEDVARAAYRTLGLCDFGRVDLRVDQGGAPWVIDINPNCDLSPDAGAARAAAHAGIEYPELIGRICELAWNRYRRSA
jgi:D-alanine-D-alanine ligase